VTQAPQDDESPGVHPLVTRVAKKSEAEADGFDLGSPDAFARASNLPERVMFAGFRGPVVPRESRDSQDKKNWVLLYLDVGLTEWLLIEEDGIVAEGTVLDESVPVEMYRNVIWVQADASVGRGSAAQAVQAQFLTGKFTRAGDFEAPPAGGTLAAATGVFCEARTPSCCRIRSRPYYP
jgi:hypothetical protein